MALMIEPPSWEFNAYSVTGTPPLGSVFGTNLTAAANNVDGAAVSVLSALGQDGEFLAISAQNFSVSAGNGSCLLDVLIDPAGGTSWAELIPDLLVGRSANTNQSSGTPLSYCFPLWIPAGASLGARVRTAHTSDITGGRLAYTVLGGNRNPTSWWCGRRVSVIGVTAAASQGQDHTPGNTGTYSSWADLGSVLDAPCGALQFAVQGTNDDVDQAALCYLYEFGVSDVRIGPPIYRANSNTESGWVSAGLPIFKSLPAGAQLRVRGTCSGTAEVNDVAAYAVH